ncbi:hypothetical protein RHSIM_Rhsim10G0093000 [Rhododendron simsii]|uniref:Uncharacterized protein n=1 Tax=Rhododendron simsii TaxID=118357 RepID=A0A834GBZ5_RHOSS|nr:hypothetical protein RHSIM_Rhsim10G0093000 [Rhododendron simsii]
MSRNILSLAQLNLEIKKYTVHCMVTEKGLPRPATSSASQYQRLLFQDAQADYPNIKGVVQVTDFNQNFIYLACSICNWSTNAYEIGNFWCNYYKEKVQSVPK